MKKNLLFSYVLSAFAGLLLFACARRQTPVVPGEDCWVEARRRYDRAVVWPQGSYQQLAGLDSVIAFCPTFAPAWMEKSVAYTKRGDYHTAFLWLNKAVEIDPKGQLGYRGWLKLMKFRDYEGAIEDFKRLDTLTPGIVDYPWGDNIHTSLGLAYRGLKKYPAALAEFDRAIRGIAAKDGEDWVPPLTWYYRALTKRDLGDLDGALADVEKELKRYYKAAEPHFLKAQLYRTLQRREESCACAREALDLHRRRYYNQDPYQAVFEQLYESDIVKFIEQNCR
jgi:tetratricopeptide (TPR) repeat protein